MAGSPATGFQLDPRGLSGPQVLTYTGPGAAQCAGVARRTVRVVPVLLAVIQPLPQSSTFCPRGAPLPLVATPAGGVFSGPGVRPGNIFDPGLAGVGTHTLTYVYTPAAGVCPSTATTTATVLPVVTVRLQPDSTVCVATGPVPLGGTPAGGTWTGPGVSGDPATGFVFTPTPALLGTQSLTYTAPGANKCGGTALRRLLVLPVPTATAAAPAGGGLCPGSPAVPLVGSPAGGTWAGPGVVGNTFVPARAQAGDHLLTYTYFAPGLSCPALARLTLHVALVLPLQLPPDTVLCPGTAGPIRLRAAPAGGTWAGPGVAGSPALGYVFEAARLPSGGAATLTYTPAAATCAAPASFRVAVAAVPAFRPGLSFPRCPDVLAAPRQVQFADAAGNPATVWDFGDGSAPATGASVAHSYAQAGQFRPVATLPYGPACTLHADLPPVEVQPLNLPNIITPNGDGLNDTFRPVFACLPRLKIFSRWGQLVYEASAYANDWPQQPPVPGTYYYLLDDGTGQQQHGWLEVVR